MISAGRFILLLTISGLVLGACKTYYIPVENFRKLYEGMDSSSLTKEVSFRGAMNELFTFRTYPIDSIPCIDGKGNPVLLANTPTLQVEIVYSAYEKSIVNFQTIRVADDRITSLRPTNGQTYYDMASQVYTRIPGDTLSDNLARNRANFSSYVYGNETESPSRRGVPISEIKKIVVVKR